MKSYLGQVRALMQEFDALLPLTTTRTEQEKLFMVIALFGLKPKFDAIKHQILTTSANPTMKDYFKRLLNMTGAHAMSSSSHIVPLAESSTLVSPASTVGGNRGRNNNRSRPQCTFCKKLGHLEDKCWKKHGLPTAPLA